MKRIKVFLEVLPMSQGNIAYEDIEMPLVNEMSNPTSLYMQHTGGIEPFILGASRLGSIEEGGDGHYFWGDEEEWDGNRQVGGKVNWFMSEQVVESDGTLNPPLTFTVIGTDIDHFTLHFDNITKEWATVINVDGKDYKNDDSTFIWSGTKANIHTFQIKEYNKPFFPIRLLGLTLGLTLEFNKGEVNRLKLLNGSVFDNTEAVYGVVQQGGLIELNDTDDNLLELNQWRLLKPNLGVSVLLNAPEKSSYENHIDYLMRCSEYIIGGGITKTFKRTMNNADIEIELGDAMAMFAKTDFLGIKGNQSSTAETFFDELNHLLHYRMSISEEKRAYLKSIKMPDGYMKPGKLLDALNEFCKATLSTICTKRSGIWLI